MNVKRFVDEIAGEKQGDYPFAFKLLGFVVYVTEEGNDGLVAGDLISPRTYHRWMDLIDRAGWGALVSDARLRQALQEYVWKRFAGLPLKHVRGKMLATVQQMLSEAEAPSLQGESRQASDDVKGEWSEAEGREAQPSALDVGADDGRLEEQTAPTVGNRR